MQTIKTLPDLPLFCMWCRNPSTDRWLPATQTTIDFANTMRELMGQPLLETGEPAPGETVWTGEEFAVYRLEPQGDTTTEATAAPQPTDQSDAADVLRVLANTNPHMVVDAMYEAGLTSEAYTLPFIRATFGDGSEVEAIFRRLWEG